MIDETSVNTPGYVRSAGEVCVILPEFRYALHIGFFAASQHFYFCVLPSFVLLYFAPVKPEFFILLENILFHRNKKLQLCAYTPTRWITRCMRQSAHFQKMTLQIACLDLLLWQIPGRKGGVHYASAQKFDDTT